MLLRLHLVGQKEEKGTIAEKEKGGDWFPIFRLVPGMETWKRENRSGVPSNGKDEVSQRRKDNKFKELIE